MNRDKFNDLFNRDISKYIEDRNGLKYLKWSYALKVMSEEFEDFNWKINEYDGKPYLYDENLGYMVSVTVTADGESKTMTLPVMDSNNKAMKNIAYDYETKNGTRHVEAATMFDINKSQMRCLVKCIAQFGLGLSLYLGEDEVKYNCNTSNVIQNTNKILEKTTGLQLSVGDIVTFNDNFGSPVDYKFAYSKNKNSYFFILANPVDEMRAKKFLKADV